jgi:spore germination cell wall hydrolase CwlJ-like protein
VLGWLTATALLLASVMLIGGFGLPRADTGRPYRAMTGLLTGQALATLVQRMDPAALALAQRFDPSAGPLSPADVAVVEGQKETPVAKALADLTPPQALAINSEIPFDTGPNPPARPFFLDGASAQDRARAVHCLAQAVYYEAAFEPLAGRRAVAQVVLNRLRHPAYPKTVCGVVYEGSDLPTGCQFSFTCDGSLARSPVAWAWIEAEQVAIRALNGFVATEVGTATHYHTQWIVPYWAPNLVKVTQLGAHIFYRWKGGWGLPASFRLAYAGGEPLAFGLQRASLTTGEADPPVEPERVLAVVESRPEPDAGGAGDAASEAAIALEKPKAITAELTAPRALALSSPDPAPRRSHLAMPNGF